MPLAPFHLLNSYMRFFRVFESLFLQVYSNMDLKPGCLNLVLAMRQATRRGAADALFRQGHEMRSRPAVIIAITVVTVITGV